MPPPREAEKWHPAIAGFKLQRTEGGVTGEEFRSLLGVGPDMARLPPPQASQALVRSDSGVPDGWLRRPGFSSAAAQSCQALRKPDADAHTIVRCNDNCVSGGRAGVVGAQTQ